MKVRYTVGVSAITQGLALLAPFVFLRTVIVCDGPEGALRTEVLLAIAAVCGILIDWSSTTFLARSQARLLLAGGYSTILVARFAACLLALALVPAFLLVGGAPPRLVDLSSLAMVIGAIALDASWILVGRKLVWAPGALTTVRFAIASACVVFFDSPTLALGIGFLCGSILSVASVWGGIRFTKRISLRLIRLVVRRQLRPTASELLTSLYSRLDVTLAAILLEVPEALAYVVARKSALGLQSILTSSARLAYLERDPVRVIAFRQSFRYSAAALTVLGLPAAYCIGRYWFLVPDAGTLALLTAALGLLLPLAYAKVLVQFGLLYRQGRFAADLKSTVGAVGMFALCVALLWEGEQASAVGLASARIAADLAYLGLAASYCRSSHDNK